MIKAVIFDLDGTITEPFLDFDSIRIQMGLAPDEGPILEIMNAADPDRRKEMEDMLHIHEQKAVEQSTLNLGVENTLQTLRDKNIHIGILTRNKRDNAIGVAEKHNLEFDAIVDREDGPAKPDAFGVLKLCEQFNVEPAETIVVGDYLFDLQSAKAAGAHAVLLRNHHNTDKFAEYADFVIDKFEQILEIICNIENSDNVNE